MIIVPARTVPAVMLAPALVFGGGDALVTVRVATLLVAVPLTFVTQQT